MSLFYYAILSSKCNKAFMGGGSLSFLKFLKEGRWCLMTVFESLLVMLTFGALIVSILSQQKK
ncbi:putative holin-like toxin [Pseudogracilibacillus auburnensis]|uniref:putative holin-like toxin n=1 Tax=Pseudogracilibacillus auburnensis TaxID=1494959 RepID=UPI0035585C5A